MEIVTFFNKVNNLDWKSLAHKLTLCEHGHGWTDKKTEVAIARYKMFLCLQYLFPNIELVPTQEIDEVWHTHILLNTYQYIQDCQHLYGYILHHRSTVGVTDETQSQNQDTAFAFTLTLFREIFGVGVLRDAEYEAAPCMILPVCVNPSLEQSACLTLPKQLTVNC
jgi:hypothetical protein